MEQWAGLGFRGAVEEFKRRLIESVLRQSGGNRTHAARRLGLQRTYLLRLIRDLGVSAPASPAFPRPRAVEARASGRPSAPVVALDGARPPALAKSVDTPRTPGVK
jgi:transposase-like protein